MPQCKTIRGKTNLKLYKSEADRWRKTIEDLRFVGRNDAAAEQDATNAADALTTLLVLYGPEVESSEPAAVG